MYFHGGSGKCKVAPQWGAHIPDRTRSRARGTVSLGGGGGGSDVCHVTRAETMIMFCGPSSMF
jgi:hypothetical protein